MRSVKTEYEKHQITKAGNNNKLLWTTIKKITGTNKSRYSNNDLLFAHSTPGESVDRVNHFFANIGKTLAEHITSKLDQHSSGDTLMSNIPRQVNTFLMLPTDEREVDDLIRGLRDDCSAGWDGIANYVLKNHRIVIVPILTFIFNLCLEKGVFPKLLKIYCYTYF